MMYSACKLNKQDDSIQPWCTPFLIWNQFIVPCLTLTVASWPAYSSLRRQVRGSGIPISLRISHSLLWSTQSKALAQSMKQMFFWNSLALFFFIINGCWIWVIIGVKLKNRHQGLAYGEIDIQIQLVCFKLLLPICWIISGFIKICSCILGPSNLPPSIYSKEQFIHIHRRFTSMFISHSLK